MKVQNKLEIQDTLKVGVIPNTITSNFSVLFNDGGDVKKRTVGSIINKNEGDYLPSVSNLFPDIFNFNNSTTFSTPNLTVSLKNQLKNTVFAAPTNLNGTPSFRFLENSDLENTTVSYQGHLHQIGDINGLNSVLNSKAGINDQRILNGQIAFNWGDFRAFGLGITNSDSTPSEVNSLSKSCFFAVSDGTSGFLDNGYYYAGINIQGAEPNRKIQLIGRTGDMKYFLRSSSDGGTTW